MPQDPLSWWIHGYCVALLLPSKVLFLKEMVAFDSPEAEIDQACWVPLSIRGV